MRQIRRTALLAMVSLVATACGSSGGNSGGNAAAAPPERPPAAVEASKQESGAIPIGVLVPLSGSSASGGEDMLNAAKLAAADINAAGGVLGRDIKIVPEDDACDSQAATAGAKKLILEKVVGIAGGYCSSAAIPATAVLDPEGVPFISAAATHPDLTDRGFTTVFRTIGRDDQQGPFAVKYLTGPLRARKIALVHDNNTYSKGLAEQVRAANETLGTGAEIVVFDAITPGESDYTSMLTKVKNSGADALYFSGFFAEGGLLLRQAASLGLKAALVGGDANQEPTLIETAGEAAEGFVVTTAPLPAFLAGAAGFVERYTEKYGKAPGPYSVYEYDAVKVLAVAIEKAGSTGREQVTAALRETSVTGLTGEISFNDKGDRAKTVYVTAIVKDGVFVPHKKLDADGNWVGA